MHQQRSPYLHAILPLCLLLLFSAVGCVPRRPLTVQRPGYFGPTESLPVIIAKINQNNQRIPTLWSNFNYDVTLNDLQAKKSTHLVESPSGGQIQYRAPGEFRLRANKTPVGLVIDMGINDEQFWLITTPPNEEASMWWGEVDKIGPTGTQSMPISPLSLLQVLAVATNNTDLTAEPAPVLRFNNDADMYMLTWVTKDQDRYVAVRETWYDRQTLLPTAVLLFDRDGRITLRAYLSNHKEIKTSDGKPGPKVATRFDIYLPDTGSKMLLNLEGPALTHRNAPNDMSFRFPGFDAVPESKVKRVDAQQSK